MRGGNHTKDIREYIINEKGLVAVILHAARNITVSSPEFLSGSGRANRKKKSARRKQKQRSSGD